MISILGQDVCPPLVDEQFPILGLWTFQPKYVAHFNGADQKFILTANLSLRLSPIWSSWHSCIDEAKDEQTHMSTTKDKHSINNILRLIFLVCHSDFLLFHFSSLSDACTVEGPETIFFLKNGEVSKDSDEEAKDIEKVFQVSQEILYFDELKGGKDEKLDSGYIKLSAYKLGV
ncbi:hypothetical protein RUM43_012876 [Polyplax serrata]|uniref:Uncharacterized protein n=1 Tax=Polyplax serrata TaxID=468196 RepID=A0AAN8S447_POLSC